MAATVLVTGASSGLGKATAQWLSKKGYRVFGTSRTPEKYKQPQGYELLPLEVKSVESIQQCVADVIQKSGRIDVVVNNAGVGITGPLEEMSMEAARENFGTNCFGPLQIAQAVLPYMRDQGSGLILNVTSIAGYMGLPLRGVYAASKGALQLLTETLRMEVKRFGIRVCSLAPGDYATDIASRRYHAPVIKKSPYKEVYAEALKAMDTHVDDGNNPLEVARAIEKLINKRKLKVHYVVGAPLQKLSVRLKKILPSRIFEKMIMNHYHS